MTTLTGLYEPLAVHLERVRETFEREVSSDLPFVVDLMAHVGGFRGKMLRPTLVLLSAEAAGGVREEHIVLAAVVEMVHMATLVHDDVLDGADMRRGSLTVNNRLGNEGAILVGDYLISHAFHLCSSLDSQEASRLIGATTNTVCEGELLQVQHRGNWNLTDSEYFEIISRKTASLTRTCCGLGAMYSPHGRVVGRALEHYGWSVGMAFQIVDDVLDLTGDEAETGKTLGTDLDKGKLTLPVIYYLAESPPAQRRQVLAVLENGEPGRRAKVAALVAGSGALDRALEVARGYVRSARQALLDLPPSAARETLQRVAEFVVARRR